jgi:hypothetical protein
MRNLLILGVVALCSELAVAEDAEDQAYSKNAEKTAATLREKIKAELKTLGSHEWAGEYAQNGAFEYASLILAPKSGYVFEWHFDVGLYDRNYGAVLWDEGTLHLSFTFPNIRKAHRGINPEFIPVAWGERLYLVPSDDIVGFCNGVNADGHPSYLLRVGDEEKEVKGFPAVPQEFKSYLLAHPIGAEIIGVESYTTRPSICDWKLKDTSVVVNRGKKHGLLKGMELHVVKPEHSGESVRIINVDDERAEGVMTQIGEEAAGPQIGWTLSTRYPWKLDPRPSRFQVRMLPIVVTVLTVLLLVVGSVALAVGKQKRKESKEET